MKNCSKRLIVLVMRLITNSHKLPFYFRSITISNKTTKYGLNELKVITQFLSTSMIIIAVKIQKNKIKQRLRMKGSA